MGGGVVEDWGAEMAVAGAWGSLVVCRQEYQTEATTCLVALLLWPA